jgi:hypothetical protein
LPTVGENHGVDESPIILVHRGNCTFVTKVQNVENAGGHVALIIDNKSEDVETIVMADDGKGKDITIPGVLISLEDGNIITEYIKNNLDRAKDIIVEVDFEMEHPSNIVKYDLYTSADNDAVYKLISEFFHYQSEIFDKTNLTVHYVTYQHPKYDTSPSALNTPKENCLGNGKYCAIPGKFGVTDGREIVYEAIKQKCIFKVSNEFNDHLAYWRYVKEFYIDCLIQNPPKFNRECSAIVMKKIGIDSSAINKCVHDSFIATDEQKKVPYFEWYYQNELLNKDNEDRMTYLLSFIPSITINGRTFSGSWRAKNLFEAICAGYKKKPKACYDEGAFKRPSHLNWFSIFMIISLIIAVNAVLFYFCKNYIKKKITERIESTDINHKINTVVTSYLALRDTK